VNPDPRDQSMRTRDPDTQPIKAVGTGERQRAAIALGVLAIVALIVVGIMVAVLGRGSGSNSPTQNANGPKGPAVTVTGGAQPSHHQSKHSGHKKTHHPQQPSSRPSNAPVSCRTSSPCDLPDDVGNVVQALNAYRTSHGKAAVRGSVTQAARTCAVTSGNSCPNGFYWEPVGRSGQQVIQKIAAGGGDSWLLDDRMTAVQVGWAYIPSSQSFECALVSNAS
jgi:hypothetical protein